MFLVEDGMEKADVGQGEQQSQQNQQQGEHPLLHSHSHLKQQLLPNFQTTDPLTRAQPDMSSSPTGCLVALADMQGITDHIFICW